VTKLPEMRVSYSAYNQLQLSIPQLGIDTEILGVPKTNGDWDVAWLGDKAGWLQGTAWPGSVSAGNSVITGHSYNYLGRPGVFANLQQLSYGSKIYVSAFGETFVYSVEDVQTVFADTPRVLSQKTDYPKMTLITCKFYNEKTGEYDGRIIVNARLEKIQ
jgi:LPXTG-site transpeptidase (sortase) family protein